MCIFVSCIIIREMHPTLDTKEKPAFIINGFQRICEVRMNIPKHSIIGCATYDFLFCLVVSNAHSISCSKVQLDHFLCKNVIVFWEAKTLIFQCFIWVLIWLRLSQAKYIKEIRYFKSMTTLHNFKFSKTKHSNFNRNTVRLGSNPTHH